MMDASTAKTKIERLIPKLPRATDEIVLEFLIETKDGAVSIEKYQDVIGRIMLFGHICRGVSLYIGWLERGGGTPAPVDSFEEFRQWLSSKWQNRTKPVGDIIFPHELEEQVKRLSTAPRGAIPADYDVAFEFLGAYYENPIVTRTRIGGAVGLALALGVAGGVAMTKELTAGDCRAFYGEMMTQQTEAFKATVRLQGRLTDELARSHKEAVETIMAAADACGSGLGRDVTIRVRFEPAPVIEVRAGDLELERRAGDAAH